MHTLLRQSWISLTLRAACLTLSATLLNAQTDPNLQQVERIWKSGQTLPAEVAARFPNPPLQVPNDTGINVLVDLAHQCAFATMWGLPAKLHPLGFRSIVSHASLHTVLTPGQLSRARVPVGRAMDGKPLRPFGWVPNPRFNVLITYQSDPQAQPYLPDERSAVAAFVHNGGGLVIVDNGLARPDKQRLEPWAEHSLATSFGVDFQSFIAGKTSTLLDSTWELMHQGDRPGAGVFSRTAGQGRIVLVSALSELDPGNQAPRTLADAKQALLKDIVTWAAAGSPPVGGEARFSQTHGGGGGIYPELEERQQGAVVYYARNQKERLLAAVRQEIPTITRRLYAWLPSPVPEEPMFIILAAGGGGGWAVNAFYPKETGTISLDPVNLFGVFAHELAHTMSGPRNAQGEAAAHWFDGNQGEAHAGWWQGKILALYSDNKSMRDCNTLFQIDPNAATVDLGLPNRGAYEKWGNGAVWKKLWWIWQKLDDRYGTTWYPRWRWVQHTRWQDQPHRQLSLDQMVEDMSIACGEDLFPFFKRLGTTLQRDRLDQVHFQGQALPLPIAPLDLSPAGNARHDPIADFTQPIRPPPPPNPNPAD
ncbi:MAG: hypothetical protein FJ387_05975 [Verrucomicrobia bacterium]|nr:hypothetical protein [Verrucomicrobiota bacterium]